MTRALRHRPFRWIGALYAVDSLLEWCGSIALMVVVYGRTDSTTVAAGMLLCKQVAPGALVPLAGPTLDRLSVGRALTVAFALQAVALLAISAIGYGPLLFPIAVLAGAAGAIVRALVRTGAALSLPGDDLRAGNAFLNIAMAVCGLAGPALAAVAVSAFGALPVLAAVAGLLAVCSALAACMPHLAGDASAVVATADEPAQDDHRQRSGAPQVPLAWLLGLVGLVTCVFSMDDPTLLAYSERALHAGVEGYGLIFAAWGVGVTAGSVVFTRLLHWPMLRVYALATTLAGCAYLGMSVSPSLGVTCAIAIVGGVGNGMDWIAIVTAVQETAPRGQEARAARHLEAIGMVGPGVGILVGGVLADLTTPRLTLLIPGVLALLVLLLGTLAVRVRELRLRDGLTTLASRPTTLPSPITGGSA
ncbi:MAG: MFS transporter [Patulibacter sp.]|nr:MFS transporter [Patulibacter sp.]